MPLNAKPSCGWPFKPVSVGASPTRGANFVREGDLVDSSPSQGEDSRSVTGHGCQGSQTFQAMYRAFNSANSGQYRGEPPI
jgi:hypothetical protein